MRSDPIVITVLHHEWSTAENPLHGKPGIRRRAVCRSTHAAGKKNQKQADHEMMRRFAPPSTLDPVDSRVRSIVAGMAVVSVVPEIRNLPFNNA